MYDRFHSRIIFPIHSASGRVIGFGGRILSAEKTHAKYVNSPESEIYNKSKTLYGIFFAKNAIISKDNCYLVEGYTDVISLFQAGIENTVASSGTSLTLDQIRMIRRYTTNITILYDGDPAGIKASFRGIDMIVEQAMNVMIVLFPNGEDPDSFARKNHPDEVDRFIKENSVNFILFKTRLLLDETRNDPIKKAGLIKEIVNTIALIPDGISRSLYIHECSALMTVSEQVLMVEMNKILRARLKKSLKEEGPEENEILPEPEVIAESQKDFDTDSPGSQEQEIIRLLLLYGQDIIHLKMDNAADAGIPVMVADYVVHVLLRDEMVFENPVFGKIYEFYLDGVQKDAIPDRNFFLTHPDLELSQTAVNLVFSPYELSKNWYKNNILITTEESRLLLHVEHSIHAFRARKLEKMMTEIRRKLANAETAEEQTILMKQLGELKKQSIRINREGLGRIIIK